MATASVVSGERAVPTIDVPAEELLQKFKTANLLSIKLSGVVGVMTILNEHCSEDTPENCTIHAVLTMIEEAFEMANTLQWGYGYEHRAERALGLGG